MIYRVLFICVDVQNIDVIDNIMLIYTYVVLDVSRVTCVVPEFYMML
jgi:hypothetical protein